MLAYSKHEIQLESVQEFYSGYSGVSSGISSIQLPLLIEKPELHWAQ